MVSNNDSTAILLPAVAAPSYVDEDGTDDDDDDDLLLQPCFISTKNNNNNKELVVPSIPSLSQSSSSQSSSSSVSGTTTTRAEIHAKALADAQAYAHCAASDWRRDTIPSTDAFRWYFGSQNKKRSSSAPLPCRVVVVVCHKEPTNTCYTTGHNPNNSNPNIHNNTSATSNETLGLNLPPFTKTNNTLVRFLGQYHASAGRLQIVSHAQLRPYWYGHNKGGTDDTDETAPPPPPPTATTTTTAAAAVEEEPKDGPTLSNIPKNTPPPPPPNGSDTAVPQPDTRNQTKPATPTPTPTTTTPTKPTTWSKSTVHMFLQSVAKQKEFQGPDGAWKLAAEELVLQLMLESVAADRLLEEHPDATTTTTTTNSSKQTTTTTATKMDEDEDNDDKYDEDDENGSEGEDSPVERDYGEDASAPPCSKNNNDNPQPVAIAEPVLPVRGIYQSGEISLARVFQSRKTKLRGGDSVLYCPPHLVANASNMEQAYVLACYPGGRGQNGVALHLSTGVHLLIHHQVSIVQRYLKGKRIDQPHPVFVALSDCAMDSSRNGSDDNVPSDATKRGEQIGACFRDIMDQVRKVEQREGSKTTNSVTESSRTVLDGEEPEHERTENDAPIKELSTSTDNTQPSANVVQRRQEEAIDPSNRISPDATEAANGRKRRREEAVNPSNKQSSKTLSDIAQRQSPPSSSLNMINPIVSVVSNISNSSQLSHQTPQLAVTLPYWEEALQILLGECDVALLRRRVDRHAIEARQSALRMALAVRQHLRLCGDSNQSTEPTDDSGRSTREKLNDFILDQWESEMDYSRDRILAYLRGNENNLIPLNSVKDLTVKFQAWMATQLDLHVVKD